ncbi:MAG: flagellar protein FlgN [Oscillospiraceae bacterium]
METIYAASDDVLETMRQIIDQLELLLVSAQKKEALIIENDFEALKALLAEESELSGVIKQLEKEMMDKVSTLCRVWGIHRDNVTLTRLCREIGDDTCRGRLSAYGYDIIEAIERLKHKNVKIKALLEQRIGYADFMLNLLHSPQKHIRAYNILGNMEEDIGNFSLLDYKA